MKKVVSIILAVVLLASLAALSTGCASNNRAGKSEKKKKAEETEPFVERKIDVRIGRKNYTATLLKTKAAKKFYRKLPEKYKMLELNGNEKYAILKYRLPKSEKKIKKVKKGDIMLYGDDTIVIFYKSFNTTSRYTRIGKLDSTVGLKKAVGSGSVKVKFSRKK